MYARRTVIYLWERLTFKGLQEQGLARREMHPYGGDCDHLNLGVSQKNFLDLGRVVFDTTRIDHVLDIVSDLSTGTLDSGYLPYWISRYSTDRFVVPVSGEPTKSIDCSMASTGRRRE